MATSGDLEKRRREIISDTSRFFESLRLNSLDSAVKLARRLPASYQGTANQMVHELANFGALRPETANSARAVGRATGVWHDDKNRAGRNLGKIAQGHFRSGVKQLPMLTQGQRGQTIKAFVRPEGMSAQDFATSSALSALTQYMDPSTQQSTRSYLARENPFLYGGYGMMARTPQPAEAPRLNYATLARTLGEATQAITPTALTEGMSSQSRQELEASGKSTYSPIKWLQEYLTTAQKGMGGTRAQQQFASERLATLEREAQESPTLQNLRTFGEDIINPVVQRGRMEGILGQKRTLQPPPGGAFKRRGLVGRNVALT